MTPPSDKKIPALPPSYIPIFKSNKKLPVKQNVFLYTSTQVSEKIRLFVPPVRGLIAEQFSSFILPKWSEEAFRKKFKVNS
jgi:hypothetical protein